VRIEVLLRVADLADCHRDSLTQRKARIIFSCLMMRGARRTGMPYPN